MMKKIREKRVILAKWYWCQIIEHISCIGQKCFSFSKNIYKEKTKICSVHADTKHRSSNDLQNMSLKYSVKRNER